MRRRNVHEIITMNGKSSNERVYIILQRFTFYFFSFFFFFVKGIVKIYNMDEVLVFFSFRTQPKSLFIEFGKCRI